MRRERKGFGVGDAIQATIAVCHVCVGTVGSNAECFLALCSLYVEPSQAVSPLPRILGMTASPAADSTMPGTILRVGQLQEMMQAKFYLVHEQDEEVSQVG